MPVVDPHARRRADTAVVRALLSKKLSNAELLAAFARAQQGKLASKTIRTYSSFVEDALAYVRGPDGREIPLSRWTKETVWEYVHYMEANYCRYFRSVYDFGASCRLGVWKRVMQPSLALSQNCSSCALFEPGRESLRHRIDAINRFFKFLCRSGVVEFNFVRDVLSEYWEDLPREPRRERRRNPSVEEMVKLVNETVHPRNRAFYACSAKWWFRPNEMMALDRYKSLPGFEEGNDVVMIPTKGAIDKRKGSRVSIIDDELRPILEQYLAWWERTVERDSNGRPKTTKLWITARGKALRFNHQFYDALFYPDCIRLGLMTEEDKQDPLRRWTGHCQRHFGEKLLMMNNCPDTWSKHFRGDIVKDARGQYFVPTIDQIREKYREWVPRIGFTALPKINAGSMLVGPERQLEIHRAVFREGMERAKRWKRYNAPLRCQRIVRLDHFGNEIEEVVKMPHRFVASYLFALRRANPSERYDARPDINPPKYGRNIHRKVLYKWCRDALAWLGEEAPPPAEKVFLDGRKAR